MNTFTSDDLLFECVAQFELADFLEPLIENGCEFYVYPNDCGFSIYAKGNIPEEYKF